MPTLESLYRQDPESLPFRMPVDPQLLCIPVCIPAQVEMHLFLCFDLNCTVPVCVPHVSACIFLFTCLIETAKVCTVFGVVPSCCVILEIQHLLTAVICGIFYHYVVSTCLYSCVCVYITNSQKLGQKLLQLTFNTCSLCSCRTTLRL